MRTKMIIIVGFSLLTAGTSAADEIVDGPSVNLPVSAGFSGASGFSPYTQRFLMHACPPNRYVTGVHNNKNWFLCATFTGATYTPDYDANTDEHEDPQGGVRFFEPGTPRVHSCPPGSVMSGFQGNKDLLLCVPSPFGNSGVRTHFLPGTTGTERATMHACPLGQVMAGINVDQNVLVCEGQTSGARTK